MNAELCDLLGHDDPYREERCATCGLPVAQYVRVEVTEGKAYTYVSFESKPLVRGDRVMLPGNVVQGPFVGTVLRVLDGPDAGYTGPYKAVLGRPE